MKGEKDKSVIIVGNFNTSLSTIGRTTRPKIRKNMKELNNTVSNRF